MALVVSDRVKELTTSTGTGAITLAGAQSNFVAFSAVLSDGDTTFYAIVDNNNLAWETGVGTYASAGNTLTRTTVLASSNAGSPVNLQAGQKDVFVTNPATQAVYLDANDKIAGNQTFSGTVTLNADPASGLQAATKQYVDTIAAAGLHYHDPVRVEQEGNLTVTYDNGTAGVGATLTNAGTQAALVIDGVTMSTSDRVLIYEQTDATQNGVYTVTDVGSASTNWVLTRATDADSYGPSDPDSLGQGDAFFVQEGALGAGETYVMNTEGTITFGTTDITFSQISSTQIYTSGSGITISGSVINAVQTLDLVTNLGATTANSVTVGGLTASGLVYPASDGTTGQFMQTDGAGNLGFATVSLTTPTLDAVTTSGNSTSNSITVGQVNATGGNSTQWNSAYNDKINSASFNTSDGILTLTQQDAGTVTVDLDGRYSTTDTNTTYTAGAGLDLTGTVFSVESDLRGDVVYIGQDTNDYIHVNTTVIDFRLDGNLDMRLENDGDLHVDGDVIAYSTTTSDRRLKDNVETIENALDKVCALRGVEYDWNATSRNGQHDIGVIAQEVEEVIPCIVREVELQTGEFAGTGFVAKTVDYEKLTAVLIEAVKQLRAEVEELKGAK